MFMSAGTRAAASTAKFKNLQTDYIVRP
jgi:hypothetical protein